ncbi:MAG: PhzF family phenazine biosynthesis protein, partial [Hyphomonadaceae bacterium]
AAENNVAETAFIVPAGEGIWELRWFTPAVEVPLCGHATLASAHTLYEQLGFDGAEIAFDTRQSGRLTVKRLEDGRLEMDFPASPLRQIQVADDVVAALGARPKEAWAGTLFAAVFETPEEIRALDPDVKALAKLGTEVEWERGNFGCVGPGGPDGADVVSRFFAPGSGIDEDPATGAWHCMLAPLMSEKLGKTKLTCWQDYPGRGAWVETELHGDRVKLRGRAVTVIEGQFKL